MKNIWLRSGVQLVAAGLAHSCLLAGCERLADAHTTAPPLASIRGTLSLAPDMPNPEGDLRLAVMWEVRPPEPADGYIRPLPLDSSDPAYPCGVDISTLPENPNNWGGHVDPGDLGYTRFTRAFAEQQVRIETEFPVQFRLDVTEPPPPEAISDDLVDQNFSPTRMALGQFVVYRDGDANGKLDMSTFAKPSADEILSVSAGPSWPRPDPAYELQWIERRPVFDEPAARRAHFNVYPGPIDEEAFAKYAHMYDDFEPGYNLVRTHPTELTDHLPNDSVVALVLNANPWSQQALCSEYCQKPADYECPSDPADLPELDTSSSDYIQSEFGNSWYYSDGPLSYREGSDWCHVDEYDIPSYSYSTFECHGCACKLIQCDYQRDTLTNGAQLPCSGYQPRL